MEGIGLEMVNRDKERAREGEEQNQQVAGIEDGRWEICLLLLGKRVHTDRQNDMCEYEVSGGSSYQGDDH